MNSEFIVLTETWQNGNYDEVADIVNNSNWSHAELTSFCIYFVKYLGVQELEILQKIL
jgi:hypothetical protein